jgi:hypothetical protein
MNAELAAELIQDPEYTDWSQEFIQYLEDIVNNPLRPEEVKELTPATKEVDYMSITRSIVGG